MSSLHRSMSADGRLRTRAKVVCATVGAIGVLAVVVTSASAATGAGGQSLSVNPSRALAGGSVTISGVAPNCSAVTLLSQAFSGATEFAGVPAIAVAASAAGQFRATAPIPATRAPGNYTITARACGGNLGITASVTVAAGTPVPTAGASIGGATLAAALLLVAAGVALTMWPMLSMRSLD